VWWNVYTALYSKFPAESGSERIFKIGLDLTKLLPKVRGFVFFGTRCRFQKEHDQYRPDLVLLLVVEVVEKTGILLQCMIPPPHWEGLNCGPIFFSRLWT